MKGFLVGLAVGIGATALLACVSFLLARAAGWLPGPRSETGFGKVMVATVSRPFNPMAVELGARMLARDGRLHTLYVAEIPLSRPLESEADEELASGMRDLELAARVARRHGVRALPRLERSRLGSKTVVELQRDEGFDAVVLDVRPGGRSERQGRKIADYIQEHVTCPVFVISESE